MARFMKGLAVVVLIVMVIGSFVLGDASHSYDTGLALSGVLLSFVVFGLLYSVGYGLSFLDDLRAFWKVPFAADTQGESETATESATQQPSTEAQSPAPEQAEQAQQAEQPSGDKVNPWA